MDETEIKQRNINLKINGRLFPSYIDKNFKEFELEEEIKDLLINEFLIDPLEGSEWVEIYNNSSSSIDLSNWSLFDGVSKIGFSTSTIEAGSYFIWEFNNKLNNTGTMKICISLTYFYPWR